MSLETVPESSQFPIQLQMVEMKDGAPMIYSTSVSGHPAKGVRSSRRKKEWKVNKHTNTRSRISRKLVANNPHN